MICSRMSDSGRCKWQGVIDMTAGQKCDNVRENAAADSRKENYDIKRREDRIGKYFEKYLKRFVFAELSEEFVNKAKPGDMLRGIPVPLREEEVKNFAEGSEVSLSVIAENMTWVIGSDPHFRHAEAYIRILSAFFGGSIYEGMLKTGRDAAEKGDMDNACIHFRAALCMKPDYLDAMYSYARACRAMYLASENEEYIGRLKAEALEWFEMLTEVHPEFAQGYYYLGYAYLNLGLYAKASISWKKFMKLSRISKDKKEIRKRLEQIEEPIRIEEGCNDILAGRYERGIERLEPFLESRFSEWWPLHYYLGVAYEEVGRIEDAKNRLKQALRLNGSHLETMQELLAIYRAENDTDNAEKYSRKIAMVQSLLEEDQKVNAEAIRREDERLQKSESKMLEPEVISVD